jgi:ribonuclease Z
VDCNGKPYQKLLQCDAKMDCLKNILITHYHVDHSYGLPSLLSSLHLTGRKEELNVLGLPVVITKLLQLMDVFDFPKNWDKVTKLYPINFLNVSGTFNEKIYDGPGLTVSSCTNSHLVANLSIKVYYKDLGKYVVYTSDTGSPNEDIIKLSQNADYLIHEVNNLSDMTEEAMKNGHSTAIQVGETARRTGINKLFLVHHGLDHPDDIAKMKKEVGEGEFELYVPDDMEEFIIR